MAEPRNVRIAPIVTGVAVAAVVIAPLAAWLFSRATQDRIDRQTSDRLRR